MANRRQTEEVTPSPFPLAAPSGEVGGQVGGQVPRHTPGEAMSSPACTLPQQGSG